MATSVLYLDDNNFEQTIAEGITLVDFTADWCGPCRMISPIIDELSTDYSGKAKVAKIDVDKAQVVASKFNVTSIPTVILFVKGEEVKRVVGVRDKKTFQTMIDAAL
jgi:thioredoxin 1